jgi:hypothetical protein
MLHAIMLDVILLCDVIRNVFILNDAVLNVIWASVAALCMSHPPSLTPLGQGGHLITCPSVMKEKLAVRVSHKLLLIFIEGAIETLELGLFLQKMCFET